MSDLAFVEGEGEALEGGPIDVFPLGGYIERSQRVCSTFIGVRDLVARGYFIPGGASQRGGGPGSDVSVSHVVRSGRSWTQVSHL